MKSNAEARILVVDDRPEQLITFRTMLSDLVDEVVCAGSGREALRTLLSPEEFAIILLDINMPTMDGFEFAALVRQHRVHKHTPIIFLTASGDDVQEQRCYSLGAVDYILAPVVPSVLRTKVRVLADLHRKTVQVRRQAEVLRRRATQLHALTAASLAIHSAGGVDEVLRATVVAARDIVGAELVFASASPVGASAPPQTALLEAGQPTPTAATSVPWLEALERFVRERGSTVRLSAAEIAHTAEWTEGHAHSRVRGYLAGPLRWSDGQPLGILQLTGKGEGEFDADDEAIVTQLAQLASIAVQNRLLGAARDANRLKDEFFSNLSHELRNPLNALAGWASMLSGSAKEGPPREKALGAVQRNITALTQLVDDLLDVSRIATNRLTLATQPMFLDAMVREVVDNFRPGAAAKSVTFEVALDHAALEVLGDGHRLTQVVTNLLSNALKFTPAQGRITVSLARAGGEAVLTVKDTGEGISPEFLPYVFERFRQAHPSTRRDHGGLGLGLAIVRSIIELHGGTVHAHSDGLGQGASFVVRLPLLAQTPRLDGYHVLLIEGDGNLRTSLERTFAGCGAIVTAVASPDEALAELASRHAHVIVAQGDQRGAEAMRRLREHGAEGLTMPALALVDGEPGEAVLAAGFQEHAPRAAGATAIAQAIRRIVPRPPAARVASA